MINIVRVLYKNIDLRNFMNIGEAALASGVNSKLIRHYESEGIIPKVSRNDSGYRIYKDSDVHILIFVKSARSLGFPIIEIKKLLSLWRNKTRASSEVKTLARTHIALLEAKINDLQLMVDTLNNLSQTCHGNNRPDCPIIDGIASGPMKNSKKIKDLK